MNDLTRLSSIEYRAIEGIDPDLAYNAYRRLVDLPNATDTFTYLGTDHYFVCATDGAVLQLRVYKNVSENLLVSLRLESDRSNNITIFEDTEERVASLSAEQISSLLGEFLNSRILDNLVPIALPDVPKNTGKQILADRTRRQIKGTKEVDDKDR